MKKLIEKFEAHPRTLLKHQEGVKILERDDQASHGGVTEESIIKKHRKKHEIQILCSPYPAPEAHAISQARAPLLIYRVCHIHRPQVKDTMKGRNFLWLISGKSSPIQ